MSKELKQTLSLYGLVMISVGASIGSGIFKSPSITADLLRTPNLIILAWVFGGVVALTGALTLGELGSLYPKAGGIYIYIREAYGEVTSFLYGWANLLVMNTGSMVGISLTFAAYFNVWFPGANEVTVAATAIVLVTIVNVLGVDIGEIFSNIFTTLKIIGIATIILFGFIFVTKNHLGTDVIQPLVANRPSSAVATAFATALIGVFWSYGGWQHTTFLSGEAKNPQRNIPMAMVIGASVVTLLYVSVVVAYMRLLPIETMAASKAVASDAVGTIFPDARKWIALLIMVSTFGTMVIYSMSLPRVYFAMANDGVFFKEMTYLHPKFRTPVVAIVAQSGWALVLLNFMRTFKDVIDYVEFMDWVFLFMAGTTIFVFRKKYPNALRPYKAWLYPVTPILFCLLSGWFLVMVLTGPHSGARAMTGLGVMFLGLPFYYLFRRQK
jgi:basic amino acid/polyamine antiporter, APA family